MPEPKKLLIGVTGSLLCLVIFLRPYASALDKPLVHHDDITYQYFIFHENYTKLLRADFSTLWDTRMWYPIPNTLAMGSSMIGQSLVGLPVYLLTGNAVVAANWQMLFGLFLAFMATYLLAYRLTSRVGAALVAGLIYTYNPYVMTHMRFELSAIEWIPLIFLATEKLLTRVRWPTALALVGLGIMQLLSSFYYFFFLVILWPVYVLVRMKTHHTSLKHWMHPATGSAIVLMILAVVFVLPPYRKVQQEYGVHRSIAMNELFSARVSDFFFTDSRNMTYGWMNQDPFFSKIRDPFILAHPSEHSLFPGIGALVFVVIALFGMVAARAGNTRRAIVPFAVLLFVSVLFSFGPYVTLGEFRIASPYLLLYQMFSFVQTLRAPSRFMVVGFLALAMLAAFGWKLAEARLKRASVWLLVGALIVIGMEYRQHLDTPLTMPAPTRAFYTWLATDRTVSVILELPIGNGSVFHDARYDREFMEDTEYLFYAVYHEKKIVNGYNGFFPPEALSRGRRWTSGFPSVDKLRELKRLGVDMIIVHQEEYPDPNIGKKMISELERLGLHVAHTEGTITAFRL